MPKRGVAQLSPSMETMVALRIASESTWPDRVDSSSLFFEPMALAMRALAPLESPPLMAMMTHLTVLLTGPL